jgi:protein transport protein SEC24
MCIFWVGLSTSPAQLKDLLDVEDINDLDPRLAKLPELETGLSAQVRNILGERQARRGGKAIKLLLARQNTDGTEIEFGDMLVEDENNANMSYLDCECRVIRQ